jgi:hypothetical protein
LIGARGVACLGLKEVAGVTELPAVARIVGAYPNPFNPVTTLVYELPASAVVDLRIYDLRGRLVRRLVDREVRGPGRQEVVWRGRDERGRPVATGVYVWRVEVGSTVMAGRVALVK